jgi:alanyl-tRNA synthetase
MAGRLGASAWTDVQKHASDLHVHDLEIFRGRPGRRQAVTLQVDRANRTTTRANHSAAHLMHAALRNVLGKHVTQKGQMVDGELFALRFFSHGGPLTADEIGAHRGRGQRLSSCRTAPKPRRRMMAPTTGH